VNRWGPHQGRSLQVPAGSSTCRRPHGHAILEES
jgi:hypothetical protein